MRIADSLESIANIAKTLHRDSEITRSRVTALERETKNQRAEIRRMKQREKIAAAKEPPHV